MQKPEMPEDTKVQDLRYDLIDLLFFAYRDHVADPDKILSEYGFGRAHHRVLYFVYRRPGMTVNDLLDILRITKQSLGRVLKQLVDKGFVVQNTGKYDRRQRLLFVTEQGRELTESLAYVQTARILSALQACGDDGERHIEAFLGAMINPEDRAMVMSRLEKL